MNHTPNLDKINEIIKGAIERNKLKTLSSYCW